MRGPHHSETQPSHQHELAAKAAAPALVNADTNSKLNELRSAKAQFAAKSANTKVVETLAERAAKRRILFRSDSTAFAGAGGGGSGGGVLAFTAMKRGLMSGVGCCFLSLVRLDAASCVW